ncbi:hypothetical protein MHH70_12525 [Metasolibacillus sp. FSL H7-0170]|uniref:hypothetical protein n=1 Tax=Metasolibacillus sp. FSL H7-0170 TaxID=2921431 RepID=UPI0031586646
MHVLSILDDLVTFLQKEMADYILKTKDGIEKAPTVYGGYLPPKVNKRRGEDSPEQEDYPFIIVRYLGDEDRMFDSNQVTYRILVGTYNEDEQNGWRDTIGLMIRVKTKLREEQYIGAASLTGTIESALFENQMKPSWHGVMEVTFDIPQIQQKNRSVLNSEFY